MEANLSSIWPTAWTRANGEAAKQGRDHFLERNGVRRNNELGDSEKQERLNAKQIYDYLKSNGNWIPTGAKPRAMKRAAKIYEVRGNASYRKEDIAKAPIAEDERQRALQKAHSSL